MGDHLIKDQREWTMSSRDQPQSFYCREVPMSQRCPLRRRWHFIVECYLQNKRVKVLLQLHWIWHVLYDNRVKWSSQVSKCKRIPNIKNNDFISWKSHEKSKKLSLMCYAGSFIGVKNLQNLCSFCRDSLLWSYHWGGLGWVEIGQRRVRGRDSDWEWKYKKVFYRGWNRDLKHCVEVILTP